MQDMLAVGGGSGRGAGIGGGGGGGRCFGGGGDRRLRPQHHQNHQLLKCPRCESPNTKFCYYNNYNLSQPRHFCKRCRRYWTRGGVLRNVPVGGGCRKSKRSKAKTTSNLAAAEGSGEKKASNSHSSSESSSLTAATTDATPSATAFGTFAASNEVGSSPASGLSNSAANIAYSFTDTRFFNVNPQSTDQPLLNQQTAGQIFPEMENLTTMTTSSEDPAANILSFNMAEIPPLYGQLEESRQVNPTPEMVAPLSVDEFKSPETSGEYLGHQIEFGCSRGHAAEAGGATGGGDQGLFGDLTGAIDQFYWNEVQWANNYEDQSLNYLP